MSILEDRNKELIIERREMEIKLDNLRINNETLIQEYCKLSDHNAEMYRSSQERECEEIRKKHSEEKK